MDVVEVNRRLKPEKSRFGRHSRKRKTPLPLSGDTDGKYFAAISRDSFGQTLDNSTDTNYDYFTGKPKVEGLGYAFLFRNYAAGLGKWTTSDPLGYPDGWNNFAYVNNLVIGCIDRFGTDIYHVNASAAVDGIGHSAAIVGFPEFGYRIINHGTSIGIGDSYNTWSKKFNTLSDALNKLNEGRTGDYAFNRIQRFDTTFTQDDLAYAKMLERAALPYSKITNNCWSVIESGLDESGAHYSTALTPNGAFNDNGKYNATNLDFNKVKNGLAE